MSDRKIAMQAVRYLSQVAEAISSQAMIAAPGGAQAIEVSVRCSDHAEHIAQYDIEDLALKFRMQCIADSMEWLMVIVRQHGDVLAESRLYVPTAADLDAVASAASAQLKIIATTNWEKLTPEAMERIRSSGYTEGGVLWLCVPNTNGGAPDVLQGDYVGAALDRNKNQLRDAFCTDFGQHIWVENVSHTMAFTVPAAPDLN
ncbi:hypothetical protein [Janthinobacterium sp. CAN_S7]|uniref:hypothetical protein n=1 Tax=Janthinobacterium sp. CAN_S7 TaxID=3071704 RepID=UPI00319E4B21